MRFCRLNSQPWPWSFLTFLTNWDGSLNDFKYEIMVKKNKNMSRLLISVKIVYILLSSSFIFTRTNQLKWKWNKSQAQIRYDTVTFQHINNSHDVGFCHKWFLFLFSSFCSRAPSHRRDRGEENRLQLWKRGIQERKLELSAGLTAPWPLYRSLSLLGQGIAQLCSCPPF